jgi:hypothetical protein
MKFGPTFQNNHFITTGGAFTKGATHLQKLDMKKSFHTMKILLDLFNLPTNEDLEKFVQHVNHFR